ncbi:MAG: alkene reductase [Pseudomonadota bacterium]
MATDASPLFEPLLLGRVKIANRMAMAPMTRHRSTLEGVPSDLNVEHYRQRAGLGMIVTEGIYPSEMGKGYVFTPGLTNEDHVSGWQRVTDAVHAEGGVIFGQIMHVGRLSSPLMLNGQSPRGPSAVQPDPTARHYTIHCPRPKTGVPYPTPQAMTHADVLETIDDFKRSAELAAKAGFDGVEIHGASGYLPHQFLSQNANIRDDEWGGSVEKRAAFLLACVDAMIDATAPEFVAVKVSPGWSFHDVFDDDPIATFSYVIKELSKRNIAYLQLGNFGMDWDVYGILRPLFDGPAMLVAGFTQMSGAQAVASGQADIVAYGQAVIANPDLDRRYRENLGINRPDTSTFYTQGAEGYTDYPNYEEAAPESLLPSDSAPLPLDPKIGD